MKTSLLTIMLVHKNLSVIVINLILMKQIETLNQVQRAPELTTIKFQRKSFQIRILLDEIIINLILI